MATSISSNGRWMGRLVDSFCIFFIFLSYFFFGGY
nr:MAG TPA: hypothetical protein [Caudoviricetes sp.]